MEKILYVIDLDGTLTKYELDDVVDYQLVIAKDFAGNMTTKKLISQRALLMLFHTSIDRSSYE